MTSSVTTLAKNVWGLALRHKVLTSVFAVLSLVLLAFGAYIGFAQIVVVLAPIAVIGYVFLRIMSRDRTLTNAAEARLVVAAVAVGTVVTGVLIQFVPYGRDHTNPPVVAEPQWADPQTRELMVRACFGCHSNEVEYPSYASVAPISWMVQSHIDEGRDKINYSEWDGRGRDTIGVIKNGSMPPSYYTRFGRHPEAKLTNAEMQALIDGLLKTPGFTEGDRGGDGGDDDD